MSLISLIQEGLLNGRIKSIKPSEASLHEKIMGFYINGDLHFQYEMIRGEMEGDCFSWHRNGTLSSRSFYVNGKLHGIKREWDENGQLILE